MKAPVRQPDRRLLDEQTVSQPDNMIEEQAADRQPDSRLLDEQIERDRNEMIIEKLSKI